MHEEENLLKDIESSIFGISEKLRYEPGKADGDDALTTIRDIADPIHKLLVSLLKENKKMKAEIDDLYYRTRLG